MTDPIEHLNNEVARGRDRAEQHAQALERVYLRLLRAAGRGAATAFEQTAITAAVNPWQPPTGDLVDGDQLERAAAEAIAPIHKRLLKAAQPLDDLGIAFDITREPSQHILAGLAARLGSLGDAIRPQVEEAVRDGFAQGLSVTQTARLIREKSDMIAPVRARMLARTDLNALANGASLQAAQAVGVGAKTWLATEDERTRETHVEADGQTVPVDQPFTVGGEQAMYPGDPDLSDEESCNCRCTVIYGDDLTAAAVGPDVADLAMVAVYPEPDEADQIAQPDGHTADKLHVTLVFLGPSNSFDSDEVLAALQEVAADMSTLAGEIGGIGKFADLGDGAPLLALPDVQGLSELRERVVAALAARGITSPSEHGWLPHMTLNYAGPEEPLPSTDLFGSPVTFKTVSLAIADQRTDVPLKAEGGDMTNSTQGALTAADSERLALLRDTFPDLEGFTDREVLAFHRMALAARSKHDYRGDGGACAICGEAPSDTDAHFQALFAGVDRFTIVAASGPGEPTRWIAPAICVENQPTEDGRVLLPDSVTWRDGVLPLGIMLDTPHGDFADAPLCGGIDTLQRIGPVIAAAGFFNDHLDPAEAPDLVANARQAIQAVQSETANGISVDLMVLDACLMTEAELNTDGQDELPPEVGEDLGPSLVDPDGDGDIDAIEEPEGRLLMAVKEGVIGGACIVPVPAIANASIAVVASAGRWEVLRVTTAFAPGCGCDEQLVNVSLVASAAAIVAPLEPPAEWFANPGLPGPTPLTVTDDGRVFGHVAPWNTCHEGFPGRCVLAPRSSSSYRKFHNGEIRLSDGARLAVGKLTLAAGHAGVRGVSEAQARAHYDNTATIAAFVRAGEDAHGVWVAGALKSNLAPELVRDLMAAPLSGDWRNGEMVAAHAVVDPGFPVLRASGLGELLADDCEETQGSPLDYLRPASRAKAAA